MFAQDCSEEEGGLGYSSENTLKTFTFSDRLAAVFMVRLWF
jgi:hypothetical protein